VGKKCSSDSHQLELFRVIGLKSRVLKLSILSLKIMVKSGIEFILKFTMQLQRYLLSCQANSAILADIFALGSSSSEGAW
jgi:hypothetical protein